MKLRDVTIKVMSLEEGLKQTAIAWGKIKGGENPKSQNIIAFSSADQMRKCLTQKRIELMQTIKEKEPQSTYELAQLTKRDIKNVRGDLKELQKVGLVLLKKQQGKVQKIQPSLTYNTIHIEISI